MRLLLDECVPQVLRHSLTNHDVTSVQRMGWSGQRNGELLRLMAASGLGVLITADRKLEFQQDIRTSGVGVIVLIARSNAIEDYLPLVSNINEALRRLHPGQVVRVSRESITTS